MWVFRLHQLRTTDVHWPAGASCLALTAGTWSTVPTCLTLKGPKEQHADYLKTTQKSNLKPPLDPLMHCRDCPWEVPKE